MRKLSPALCRLGFATVVAWQLVGCSGSPEERAQRFYHSGKEFLDQHDDIKAEIEFKNALKAKGDLVEAWRGLAEIEEHKRGWREEVAILRKIIEIAPKDVDTHLKLARIKLIANALDDAMKSVEAAAQVEPERADVLALRAGIRLKLHDNKGAVQDAEAALKKDSDNVDAQVVLAVDRFEQGDVDGAIAIADKIRGQAVPAVQILKIKLYENKGETSKVEALLQDLTKAHPEERIYLQQLVAFYINQKRPADAERELRRAADQQPPNRDAGLALVRYLNATKGTAAAEQELEARVRGGGDVFAFENALADLYFSQHKIAEAKQLLEKMEASTTLSADQVLMARGKLAELQFKTGNTDVALSMVSAILQKDTRNADALRLRAMIDLTRGDATAAVTDLREALSDQPRSVDLNAQLAIAYERAGSIELAEKQYAETLRISNSDPGVGLNYVAFLRRRGTLDRAEEVLGELLEHAPNNVNVLSTLAEVRLSRQNWAGAQEVADTIRRAGDQRGIADQVLGAALSGQKKYDQSISVLESAYAAKPDDVQSMSAVVNTLIKAQKLDRATTFLQTVLKKNADNAEAHILMASIQVLNNQTAEASKSYQEAITRQPKSAIGYQAFADFLRRQKQPDEAMKVVQDGLQAVPESVGLRLIEASLLEGKSDYEAAITDYETILKQQPGSMIAANNLASLLADYRTDSASYDRAYTVAQELRQSLLPQFKDTLGWVHYRRGESKAAQPYLEAAVEALPNSPLVRYHEAMNLIALGEPDKAGESLKKALELASGNATLEEKIKTAQRSLSNN